MSADVRTVESLDRDRVLAFGIDLGILVVIGFAIAIVLWLLTIGVSMGLMPSSSELFDANQYETGSEMSDQAAMEMLGAYGLSFLLSLISAVVKWVLFAGLFVGYFVGFQTGGRRTPGKRVVDLRLERTDAGPVNSRPLLKRTGLFAVPFVALIPLSVPFTILPLIGIVFDPLAAVGIAGWVGLLVAITDEDGRHIADRVAGTRVVRVGDDEP